MVGIGELLAALYTAAFMFALLLAAFLYFKYVLKDPGGREGIAARQHPALASRPTRDMTSYLTLLLATLGIMIGLFTVTGFINRMGAMLLDLGSWNIMAMIFMAYIFGWLVGAGLPPTATYIIGAVVIVQPLRRISASIPGSRISSSSCCRSGASCRRRPRSPPRSRRASRKRPSCGRCGRR